MASDQGLYRIDPQGTPAQRQRRDRWVTVGIWVWLYGFVYLLAVGKPGTGTADLLALWLLVLPVLLVVVAGYGFGDGTSAWRIDSHGLARISQARTKKIPWSTIEHVVVDGEGARLLTLTGEVRIGRDVERWSELVDRIERELWQRHGRHVPRVREVPVGAVSLAEPGAPVEERGLSRSAGEQGGDTVSSTP